MGKARVIYWFRTDLRLHDSPALKAALDLKPDVLWPIFTWDPHYVFSARGAPNRWQLDCQNDLSGSITKLNSKSQLFVVREAPQTLFPKLLKAWRVTHLVFEKDTDAYAKERDAAIMAIAKKAGVEVIMKAGRTLWDSDELVAKHGGKPTMSITQLQAAGEKIGEIPKPIPAPKSLPDPGETPLNFKKQEPDKKPDFNEEWRAGNDNGYAKLAGPKGDFAVVTMEELGFPKATTPHRGGETIALQKLDEIMSDLEYISTFRKPKTSPAAFEPQSTTLLSPYHHFGALSVRLVYWQTVEAIEKYKKKGKKDASTPPESMTGQLLFRDMYFAAQAAIGYPFGQTANNAYVRFVPWHLPSTLNRSTGRITGSYEVDSPQADVWFRRWRAGVTGFPWIDALMRQLREEGWIHHLGRHAVACFLTRGGCYVHWERGCEVFEELLIDHEPACNAGNWQWLSCTAFFSQFYRCYSPVAFPRRWDEQGAFVRRWVPELKDLPAKYIYEPWKAPIADQKKAGVRVVAGDPLGEREAGTYPKPMFDFNERRNICIASLKKAYEVGLHGNDARALDGSFKELFADDSGNTEMQGDIGSDTGTAANNDDDHVSTDGEREAGNATQNGGKERSKRGAKQQTLDRHVKKRKA
ncbi:putative dna photolyase protein [Phaeoacremonium minimum UCRPA7]|uniref:Putative dna photolyase protein n=1 Tax=Phaeoacremonium minimum (strain UCR-PA7) TaxID=1286976 RepID=R8BUI7_PHAM7|nr:putative dna photolyase protein [Phaeoacremonium minimum UCRPA7]EOO03048.1 putative dna photolyase protein [Phaeoacremonium minimum UCRPA7]